jgi:ComF family protein
MQSTRLVERGYNQAALLARALGSHWQLRVAYHALQRRRDVSQQVGLSRAERQRNVLGAFVAESQILSQKRVILVDDVVTTGATSSNCRVAIEQAGATVVAVVAVAHAAS